MTNSYVIFKTPTILDIRAITVMGLNAKPNTKSPIGYFGTGLKMAIATLTRHNIPVTIFIGAKTYTFSKKTQTFRDVDYEQIRMDRKDGLLAAWQGEDLGYTTQLAKNWELWMAFRELESNTRDEGGRTELFAVNWESGTDHNKELSAAWQSTNNTVIIVGPSDEFRQVYEDRDTTFLPGGLTEWGENESIQIFHRPSNYIYYRSMRVMKLEKPSMMTYNILSPQKLTEDRTLSDQWWLPYQIVHYLVEKGTEAQINHLMNAKDTHWEAELPFDINTHTPSETFLKVANRRIAFTPVRGSYTPPPRIKSYVQKFDPKPAAGPSLAERFETWLTTTKATDLETATDLKMLDEVLAVLKGSDPTASDF